MTQSCDCLIIGGGPAGLMAAVYLSRFLRRVTVVDAGASRAALIPASHNYPGMKNGISGVDILKDLREQAQRYGALLQKNTVTHLAKGFTATLADGGTISAPRVILATGIVDEKPNLPRMPEFIYAGAVRFCPICDGYEAADQRIAVIGPLRMAVKKAAFLRTYSRDVSVLALDNVAAQTENAALLKDSGLPAPHKVSDLYVEENCIAAECDDGQKRTFDILYPAMGAKVRSDLALALGAEHADDGCVCTNDHHETSVPGLYAIGDISTELHQISVAYGHAAIASTHVHNSLEKNLR